MLQTLAATNMNDEELTESMQKLLIVMQRLDQKIAPMLEADGELFNKRFELREKVQRRRMSYYFEKDLPSCSFPWLL